MHKVIIKPFACYFNRPKEALRLLVGGGCLILRP